MVQTHVSRLDPNTDWEILTASRHFETCFKHPAGVRFEAASIDAQRNHGLSSVTFSGQYFALASVYEQMRLISHLNAFKGGYHWTRLDAQVTTLNPSQSAEQIVEDVEAQVLWVKGYQGWKPEGLRGIDGKPVNGMSVIFGAPSSDRRAESYNKAAEQKWPIPARRDEVRLRGDWAERHMAEIATAITGAGSENEAVKAYGEKTAATIAQHMQYLDLKGAPLPRPQNWARGMKPPKWWKETLETEHEPLQKNRKAESDIWERMAHMRTQWAPTWAEACAQLWVEGKADSMEQAAFDLSASMLQHLKPEHVQRVLEKLPHDMQGPFLDDMNRAADSAAVHRELS